MLILKNSVFRVRNLEIWALLSIYEFELLMLRNRVMRLGNVYMWVVQSC